MKNSLALGKKAIRRIASVIYSIIIVKPGIALEEAISKNKTRKILSWSVHLEKSFRSVEELGGEYRGWALTKSAIRCFCTHLLKNNHSPNILEFGGGQSTLFWSALMQHADLNLNVTTFEHHPFWGNELKKKIADLQSIKVELVGLKQITDEEWKTIFINLEKARDLWNQIGTEIPQMEYENTRIHNAFYNIPQELFPEQHSIDGMILDGPHGNGRSLAFALFYGSLKPNAWVLIDDFNHYPFLDDLAKALNFDIVEKSTKYNKPWVVVKLNGYKNKFH